MTTYILAKDLEDARQWTHFNGVPRDESVYLGQSWNIPRRIFAETDRIVRTAMHQAHPAAAELERWLQRALDHCGLTETCHGGLVRQER